MFSPEVLNLNDRTLVIGAGAAFPPGVSELSFTNLFVWRQSRPVYRAVLEDSLCFFVRDDRIAPQGWTLFGPPLGKTTLPQLRRRLGAKLVAAVRLPETAVDGLDAEGARIVEDRNNFDYIYLVSELVALPGRRFAKKRNLIRQCQEQHHLVYESVSAANIGECLEMQKRWCRHRSCAKQPELAAESGAVEQAFAHFQDFSLLGGAVRVDGIIQAFSLGEALGPDTAVCHFEKAMPDIIGLGQVINQQFAKHALSGFTFVNREQDLGLAGLRQAKKSYFPHHLLRKYQVFF